MPSLTTTLLAAVLAGTTLSAALPATGQPKQGTVSIKQIPNPNPRRPANGPLAVYRTYAKFGVPIPDWLHQAVANVTAELEQLRVARRDTGSVPAVPIDEFDDAYVCAVEIGTPAQTLNLDFDTGSSDFWVFSSETKASEVNGQSVYDPSKSSTSQAKSGYTWDISYGDGSSSSGDVYTDVVSIGGLAVKNQAVECAKEVSTSFSQETEIDGLVGLGFDALNTVSPSSQSTFFTNAMSSLDQPLFTADLKYHAAGTYNFGYIDKSAYTGDITYVDVTKTPGYWLFTSTGYGVGSKWTSSSIRGIADTGTTLLYLPNTIVRAYYAQVSGARNRLALGGWVFPCSADLPDFSFGVGSARITIPGAQMNYGAVSGDQCFGGVQSSASVGINIFGDVALKAAFVVFKGGNNPQLGWAAKNL